jgi:peptidoglycan-N-acetylglucosamine deacetylase
MDRQDALVRSVPYVSGTAPELRRTTPLPDDLSASAFLERFTSRAKWRSVFEAVGGRDPRLAQAIHKRVARIINFGARVIKGSRSGRPKIARRTIHLTFDDGPHPINTPKLLDELRRAGILATFFVVGKNLETPQGQELMRRAAAEGHQIGNHTYSHPHLTELSEAQIREEISRTEMLIGDASKGVKLFRPPYGEHNSLVDQVAHELGYSLVLWNVDTMDWHPKYEGRWVQQAMEKIVGQEESLVLAHDRITATAVNVGRLIANVRKLSGNTFISYRGMCPSSRKNNGVYE